VVESFDSISHRGLMKCLKKRMEDENILNLIWKFLRSGVIEKEVFHNTMTGTPQGGILTLPTKWQTWC